MHSGHGEMECVTAHSRAETTLTGFVAERLVMAVSSLSICIQFILMVLKLKQPCLQHSMWRCSVSRKVDKYITSCQDSGWDWETVSSVRFNQYQHYSQQWLCTSPDFKNAAVLFWMDATWSSEANEKLKPGFCTGGVNAALFGSPAVLAEK